MSTGETRRSPSRGDAMLFTVATTSRTAEGAAYRHLDSPVEELREHVAFDWAAMDSWFEEDEQVDDGPSIIRKGERKELIGDYSSLGLPL